MYYFLWDKYSTREGHFDYKRNYEKLCRPCRECGVRQFEYVDPVVFNISGEPCDFYMVNGLTMISEKFLNVLHESKFSGFEIRNAIVGKWDMAKNENDVNRLKYYELVIKGKCGLLRDPDGQELLHCKTCGSRMLYTDILTEGVSFDKESYDGSDIFSFDNWSHVPIVSDRVKKVLVKNKLTNLKFISLDEKVFDERVSDALKEKWIREGKVSDALKAIWNSNSTPETRGNIPSSNIKTAESKTEEFFIPKKFKKGSYTLPQLDCQGTDNVKLTYGIGGGFDKYLFLHIPEFGTKTSIKIPREGIGNLTVTYDVFDTLKSVYAFKDGKKYLMYINFKSEAERKKKLHEFIENESHRIYGEIVKLHCKISSITKKYYYDGLSVGYSFAVETIGENGDDTTEEYIDCEDYDFNAILSCTEKNKRNRYFLSGDSEFTKKVNALMLEYANKTDSFRFLVKKVD